MVSSFDSALMRLCTWRALLACARNRSMNECSRAVSRCLARGHGRRLLDAGGVLALEIRVVAGPVRELAALEIDDAVDDVIEELAIVRHQQQRAGETLQPVLRATAPRRGPGGWSARRA